MGQRVGKIKTIYRAFFKRSTIDRGILSNRREQCLKCEYNSLNKADKDMGWFSKLRKKIMEKPFCTACGCFIEEKTASITEACGLEIQGKYPKWRRIYLETVNRKRMNLVNRTEDLVNPRITDEGTMILDLGEVTRDKLKDIQISLEVEEGNDLTIINSSYGCTACTKVSYRKVEPNRYDVNIWINWDRLNGKFSKPITFTYKLNKNTLRQFMRVEGTISN